MSKRYFEFGTQKFWEITHTELQVSVRFGKLGVQGQTTVKDFESADEATKYAEKVIAEKTKKGYEEKPQS
jgi:predicted DNA-binding WGR domain protein